MTSNLLATDLQNHGIAVNQGVGFCIRPWRDAATGRDYVYVGIISNPSIVVQLDVATGRCREFRMPAPCGGPWSMDFTLEGHVLVTSICGRLCRLDPETGKFWITANTGHWIWSISRGADGKFYIGTSSECRLFRYDAATEKCEDLGQMDKAEKYLRPVIDGDDGYIYGAIGSVTSQVFAYHIATGRVTKLLPKSEVGPNWQLLAKVNGHVYCQTIRRNIYRLAQGQAFLDKEQSRRCQAQSDGQYLSKLAVQTLPDGRVVSLIDLDAIQIGEGAKAKIYPLKYHPDGTNIFHLAAGPNQTVYASTIYPLHLLRYIPAKRKLEDLGRGGPDRAEAYSIGHCDGKVYFGTYSQALLMQYDPSKPLHKDRRGQQKWKTNPLLLGYLGKGNCRPRAICVDVKKKVWLGGIPEYGYRHGGLASYDTLRKKLVIHDKIIADQSIVSLAADEASPIIYGGTSIGRGGGLSPVTKEAHLFAWDTLKNKVLWKLAALPGVTDINNLLCRDGKLYGGTGKPFSFFCFDLKTRKMDYVVPSEISGVREQSMCFGPDGNIYGITWMTLFRWHVKTGQIEVLHRCLGDDAKPYTGSSLFHRGAVIIDGRFYFSCGPVVMSMRLPV